MTESLSADVVVVGAGLAGALIASQLSLAGASVLLLEAGPRIQRWRIVENFRNSPAKDDYMLPYPPSRIAPHPEYHAYAGVPPSATDVMPAGQRNRNSGRSQYQSAPASPGGAHRQPNNYLILKGADADAYAQQYIRAAGGTTWHWAAATWRYLPNDFRLQSTYGVGRDWPIGYRDLEPYYYRAEVELGVSGPNDGTDLGSPRSQPYPMDALPLSYNDRRFAQVLNGREFTVVSEPVARNSRPYDRRPTCCGNNNCMPICPIAAMYNGIIHVDKAERAGARLLTDAVVYRVEVDARERVRAVHYLDANGRSHQVTGKYLVLAANGIETPKLLLISADKRHPGGIANSSDQVGRNMMDHPGTGISFLAREPLWPGRGPMEMTSIINFRDGAFRSQYAAKKLHLNNAQQTRKAALKALSLGLTGRGLDLEIRRRSAHLVNINSFHDLLPDPENRLVASTEHKDALGIPQPEVTYTIGDYTRKSARHTRELYTTIARLFGATEIEFDDEFAPNNHIMGSVIMGSDPGTSVVDGQCRTHDCEN
jgi:glucose dehydrogenase